MLLASSSKHFVCMLARRLSLTFSAGSQRKERWGRDLQTPEKRKLLFALLPGILKYFKPKLLWVPHILWRRSLLPTGKQHPGSFYSPWLWGSFRRLWYTRRVRRCWKTLNIVIYFMFAHVCLRMSMCTTCIPVPMVTNIQYWMSWDRSYRCLWATWCGYWELNPGPV